MPEPTTERATPDPFETEQRRQIIEAAGTDLTRLSEQTQHILTWFAKWDTLTTACIVGLLHATRTAAQSAIHGEVIEEQRAALRESVARTEAAFARCDER